jgi:hypothetical protein
VSVGFLGYWLLNKRPQTWPDPYDIYNPGDPLAFVGFAATVAVVAVATPARRWLRDRRTVRMSGIPVRLDWPPPDDDGWWDVGVMGLHGDVVNGVT